VIIDGMVALAADLHYSSGDYKRRLQWKNSGGREQWINLHNEKSTAACVLRSVLIDIDR